MNQINQRHMFPQFQPIPNFQRTMPLPILQQSQALRNNLAQVAPIPQPQQPQAISPGMFGIQQAQQAGANPNAYGLMGIQPVNQSTPAYPNLPLQALGNVPPQSPAIAHLPPQGQPSTTGPVQRIPIQASQRMPRIPRMSYPNSPILRHGRVNY